jgi:superfamily II DNA or RNA helicase
VKLEENPSSDFIQQEQSNIDDVENIFSCASSKEKFYENMPNGSFRRMVYDNSNCLTSLLDHSILTVNSYPSSANFYNVSKDIISGNYGLLFEEFYGQNLGKVPVVEALAKADDELMLYKYYTNDNMFVPGLKLVNCSYRPEYEKLENWFCDYFFKILRERVSTEEKDIGKEYYEELERDFIDFRYSIDDTIQSLGLKKNREKYLGFDNINFMILFFKKVIRSKNISPDCVDIAGKVFIPGSAMFFLELYSLLKDVEILDVFQKTIKGMKYEDKIELVHSPRVLVIPWPHQKEAFETWKIKERNGIIEMATATGKTLLGLMAIEAISKIKDKAVVRIFSHSTAILNQWRREVIEKLGLLSNIQGDYTKFVYCNGISVYFNTLQSVYKNPESYPADLLIVDEVHHLAARQYSKALDIKCGWKMGLSATIEGGRLNILEDKLGPVIYNFSLKEALEKGVLPKFEWKIHTVYLSIDEKTEFDNISKKIIELFNYVRLDYKFIQEISDGKLETIENLYDFVQIVEKARYRGKSLPDNWKQLQLSIIQRRWIIHRSKPKIEDAIILAKKYLSFKYKIVIFAMDIKTCELIAKELEKDSENVFVVHSKLKKDVNERILKFTNAQYGALIGARMLDEGIDIPDAEIGINVSSSKTRLQLIQRMGRVLRMKEGKKPVFHHYIAIPEQNSYVNVDDNLVMIDDLSWIQDTALKMGVNAELINEEQPLEKLRLEAEKMIRDNYSKTKKTNLPGYGTLKVENILGLFPDFAIQSIIDKLSESDLEYQVSDTEWSDIVRKAHGKKEDEPLTIPGYWWILLLGDRNPVKVKEIFQKFQNTISSEISMN